MMEKDGKLVIEGVQEDGRKFRPSDWIERISANLARFGPDHRLHYAKSVQPCVIDGEKCLVVEKALYRKDPAAFDFIMEFARSNKLRIIEDRRDKDRPVAEERRGR